MGSQLQLCLQWVVTNIKCTKFWSPLVWLLLPLQMQSLDMAMVMVMDLVVSALELVFIQLGQSMSLGLLRVLVREVLTQDILPMDMDWLLMVMDLVVSALELVFIQLGQFMSPDLLRVLVREALMQSQVTTHGTIGHQLLLLTATLLAMDVMAREVLSLDI